MNTVNVIDQQFGNDYAIYCGDSCQLVPGIPDDSIHLTVYSPPFPTLYIYSHSEADMGNNADADEFMDHYRFLVQDLYRVTMPGRLTCVHVKDLPVFKMTSGWSAIEDFSGMVSALHREQGWLYHSRITIWKDPVTEMQRTKSHGLLHKSFAQSTQACRVAMPDYIMVFVKPDYENMGVDVRQLRTPGDYIGTEPPLTAEYLTSHHKKPSWYPGTDEQYRYSIAVWQRYASPVWFDIDQSNTLNYKVAKSSEDEKHMAPLQLDVIERCIQMWSNPGETVLTPFMGIGSEVVSALKLDRKAIGIELKPEYFAWAHQYAQEAETQKSQFRLPGF